MRPFDSWLCSVGQEWTLLDNVRHFLVVYRQHWGLQGQGDLQRHRKQAAERAALPVVSSPALLVLGFHVEIPASRNDFFEGELGAFVLSVYLLCLPRRDDGWVSPPQKRWEETATRLCVGPYRRQERRSLWPGLACVLDIQH